MKLMCLKISSRHPKKKIWPKKKILKRECRSTANNFKVSHCNCFLFVHNLGTPSDRPRLLRRRSSIAQDDFSTRTVIVCKDVPSKYNNQAEIRKHFNHYGKVIKVYPNTRNKMVTIHFADHVCIHLFSLLYPMSQYYKILELCPFSPPPIFFLFFKKCLQKKKKNH